MMARGAVPDTVAIITLNEKGRAVSYWASTGLDPHGHGGPSCSHFFTVYVGSLTDHQFDARGRLIG